MNSTKSALSFATNDRCRILRPSGRQPARWWRAIGFIGVAAVARANFPITSLTTTDTAGTAQSRSVLDAGGATVTVNYNGVERVVTSLQANGNPWAPVAGGQTFIRRNNATATFPSSNPNQTVAWNLLLNPTAINLGGEYYNTMEQLYSSGNILTGTDNLFSNTGNSAGNNNNIERIDFVFTTPVAASSFLGFYLLERGAANGHDAVKVAAITALSGTTPTDFSNVVTLGSGAWGTTALTPATDDYNVLRYNTAAGPQLDRISSTVNNQPIGGQLMTLTSFVTPGTVVYGYSLFANDVTATGSALASWLTFPTGTAESTGGIDLVGSSASLVQLVPEPAGRAGVAFGGLGCLAWVIFRRQQRGQGQPAKLRVR